MQYKMQYHSYHIVYIALLSHEPRSNLNVEINIRYDTLSRFIC